jgi:predicted amidophosphoribosyltransferase
MLYPLIDDVFTTGKGLHQATPRNHKLPAASRLVLCRQSKDVLPTFVTYIQLLVC